MAKKKKDGQEEQTQKIFKDDKEMFKKYGNDIVLGGNFLLEEKKIIIPFSPRLDYGLGGGIQEGTWVIMSGPTACGKSYSALGIAAQGQKEEYGGRTVVYDDVEGRLKKMNLTGTVGLDLNKLKVVRSTKESILSAEDHLSIVEHYIRTIPGAIVIIDSSSALCSSKEQVDAISGSTRSLGPKILAAFCRRMANVVPIQNSIVIIINHLIANTSGYGPPLMEDSGRKVQYQADYKLRCKSFAKWEDTSGKQIGIIPEWEVIKSAMGPPGARINSYLRFGEGLDSTMEWLQFGVELGIIGKAGAWFALEFIEGNPKLQGELKLYQHLKDNPEHLQQLIEMVKLAL